MMAFERTMLLDIEFYCVFLYMENTVKLATNELVQDHQIIVTQLAEFAHIHFANINGLYQIQSNSFIVTSMLNIVGKDTHSKVELRFTGCTTVYWTGASKYVCVYNRKVQMKLYKTIWWVVVALFYNYSIHTYSTHAWLSCIYPKKTKRIKKHYHRLPPTHYNRWRKISSDMVWGY